MPVRPFPRDQLMLMPPSFSEVVPADHWIRFVDQFVDALSADDWAALGIDRQGATTGAPAYHPEMLLRVWVAGFMGGLRSARQLETACRDQLPFRWLTANQQPDHNTLWRFYAAHRVRMRHLLTVTVRTAVAVDLVDLAVLAVDGTKISGNVARERMTDEAGLQALLERTEAAITALEAQNARTDIAPSPRLPERLRHQQALKERVTAALKQVTEGEPTQASPTDPDAVLVKTRHGFVAGYNAQAAVVATHPVVPPTAETGDGDDESSDGPAAAADYSAPESASTPPVARRKPRGGLLMVATDVITNASDHEQLVPVHDAAVAALERTPARLLADGGYHSGATLAACAAREQVVIMPDAQDAQRTKPYHKDQFIYAPETDTYTCPEGRELIHAGSIHRPEHPIVERYRMADPKWCHACPVRAECTKDQRHGRTLEITHDEAVLRAHRDWMDTEEAKAWGRLRKTLPEPVFGILKAQRGVQHFWLRGRAAVQAEWSLIATGFNLRTLAKAWQQGYPPLQRADGTG